MSVGLDSGNPAAVTLQEGVELSSDPNHDAEAFFDNDAMSKMGDDTYGKVTLPDDVVPAKAAKGKGKTKAEPFKSKAKAEPKAKAVEPAKTKAKVEPAKGKAPAVVEAADDPLDPDDDDLTDDPVVDDGDETAGWDSDLTAYAESQYDLTADEIAEFGSEQALRRALAVMDKRAIKEYRAGQKPAETPVEKPVAPVAKESPKPVEKPVEKQEAPAESTLTKLELGDANDFDETSWGVLSKINDHYHGQVSNLSRTNAQLQEQIKSLMQFQEQQVDHLFDSEVDAFFVGLGDEYADELGAGPASEITAEQKKIRQEIADDAVEHIHLTHKAGRQPPGLRAALKRMSDVRFLDKTKSQARKQVADAVKERKGQSVYKPTQRREPTGGTREQNAVKYVKDFYKEHGGDQSLDDELAVLGD